MYYISIHLLYGAGDDAIRLITLHRAQQLVDIGTYSPNVTSSPALLGGILS